MKRIVIILIALIFTGTPFYVCHAEFGIGLPSVIKKRVEDLDKKVEEKKKAEENLSPNVPSNPVPMDEAKGCSVTQDISWSGGDPDGGDTVVYDVYFGVSISPSIVSAGQSETTYDPGTLNNNTVYYWKIVAKDNHGASTIGEVWSFETDENQAPNVPSNPVPTDEAKGCPLTQDISWSGGDPDGGDTVLYDVYFGDSISPALVSADQSGTTYDPGTLNNNTVYYWKIVAKDNHGASTIGEVWSFETVIIRSWKTAEMIDANDGNVYSPQVAIGQDGNALAVWRQDDGTRWNIWANRYVSGLGWETAELIETDNTGNAYNPQVAIGQDSNAIAVWSQWDGTRYNICANRYVSGSGWQTVELIDAGDESAYNPQVEIGQDGNAIAVWFQYDGTSDNIYANRYVSGSGWQTAELIEVDNGSAYSPQVEIGQDGNAIAVWRQYDGTRYNICANRYVTGLGWQTAELIEVDNGSAYSPQVAIGQDGNAIAVWDQDDGTRNNIYTNRYISGSGWQTAELIETDDTGSAGDSHIAIGQDGNALAVWRQYDGTRNNICANRYVSGLGWQTVELIETYNESAYYPQLAMGQDGNAIVVWRQYNGTRYNICANRYVSGSGWQTAELIETDDTGDAYYPQVAIGQDGNALAVWYQPDGIRNNIWANRYDEQ